MPSAPELINLAILKQQSLMLSPRKEDAHKGDFGHVLVVGGNQGFSGAAILAAEGASRAGAGLVSCATHSSTIAPLLTRCPTVMAMGVESGLELLPLLEKASVLAVGPGLGECGWSEVLLQQALMSKMPLVLDADGLNLLAQEKWQQNFKGRQVVLTPHTGEAARLLACSAEEIQKNRVQAVLKLVDKYQAVVVLKGAGTLIADLNGDLAQCTAGNPGMSSGGMGDVLTGIIAALLAQGLDAYCAAKLGVCLHAHAADEVMQRNGMRGMLATDLLPQLQYWIN